MANRQDIYDTRLIVNRIEHAVITNTNAPEIVCSLYFTAASRASLSTVGNRRCPIAMSRASSSLRAARAKRSSYSSMEFPLLAELLSHFCKGFTGFIGTGTGNQAIVEVFPQISMLLEIDEHGSFLTSVIHNELNTFHVLTILLRL